MELPIIASPMDTIVESEMAVAMANLGGLGVLHRYNTIEEQVSMASMVSTQVKNNSVAAALPISGDFVERAQALMHVGVKIMCVDVAHDEGSPRNLEGKSARPCSYHGGECRHPRRI